MPVDDFSRNLSAEEWRIITASNKARKDLSLDKNRTFSSLRYQKDTSSTAKLRDREALDRELLGVTHPLVLIQTASPSFAPMSWRSKIALEKAHATTAQQRKVAAGRVLAEYRLSLLEE